MPRLASTLVVSLALLFTLACKKDPPAEDAGKTDASAAKQDKAPETKQPTAATTAAPDPGEVADGAGEGEAEDGASGGSGGAGGSGAGGSGAGGSGGGGPALADEDKTCDPTQKGECLEGETCMGGQGCDAVWECDAEIVCKKGVREYCGCDGKTFEAVYGNCPWKQYQYPGPCK